MYILSVFYGVADNVGEFLQLVLSECVATEGIA